MYVKVHNVGNQWFRDDNGALVGKEVNVQMEHRNVFILDPVTGNIIIAIYGYLDKNNSFNPLCSNFCYKESEKKKCPVHKIIDFCNIYPHENDGYYIVVPD